MKILKIDHKFCLSCMEEHDVNIVEIAEQTTFKGVSVDYEAIYEHCPTTEEYLESEEMVRINNLSVKDAYRRKVDLLTSEEIKRIRENYGISQKDFSEILDWGRATITRYENHQVQDRAHDDILRKIDSDPKWLLDMLKRSKDRLSEKAYLKYHQKAMNQYSKKKNQYLIDAIFAYYATIKDDILTGNMPLELDKVVEVINYLARKVNSLHKVKLMKMLWYSDALNYKRYGKSITGLAYSALPMGAVPEGYEEIIRLEGVSFDLVVYNEYTGYKFRPTPGIGIHSLCTTEIDTINTVVAELGSLKTEEIVDRMHEEDAYKCTQGNCIISYVFAEELSLQ